MRNAFADEITRIGCEDPRVVLLSGDIGNRLFDRFKEQCPARFFNCGVAEGNMVSVAAGMAMCGLRPVTYTIASFMTSRCFEQIRVDVCYQHVPVVIVGVGGGLAYAANGGTHHSCEDLAILRVLPHMTVMCPADPVEAQLAVRAALQHDGPSYIRLGKKGEPKIHATPPRVEIGKATVLQHGTDVCLLGAGTILPLVLDAAQRLALHGISAQVVSFHTIKPLDEELLMDAFTRFDVVATIEEHSILGGLGGAVAEWLADHQPSKARLCRIGTADTFLHEAGEQEHAREVFGLTAESIAERVLRLARRESVLAS